MGCGSSKGAGTLASSSVGAVGDLTLLVIGLDNSGKSTLISALTGDIDPYVVPTVGFATPVSKRIKETNLVFYDLGGGSRIRGVWPSYFAEVHGIIYLVDSSDKDRLEESGKELRQALEHKMVVGKPLLV